MFKYLKHTNTYLLCFLLCCFSIVYTSKAQEYYTINGRAGELFIKQEYALAAKLFEKIIAKDKTNTLAYRQLAVCYREINNYAQAEKYYGYIIDFLKPEASDFYHLAEMQKSQGKYAEARRMYQRYQEKTGENVQTKIEGCDSAQVWLEQTPHFVIQNLWHINSGLSDWGAVTYQNSAHLVFVSDSLRDKSGKSFSFFKDHQQYGRTAAAYQKIYIADSMPSGAVFSNNFSNQINGADYHTGPIVFSANYDTAFYTVTHTGKTALKTELAESKLLAAPLKTRTLELFMATKSANGSWQPGKPFMYNRPEAYSLGHAALSKDGNILYFTSDMPGGYGGLDIWFCERLANNQWTQPVNCGALINTASDEAFPVIGKNGNLYFASKGLVGMGGFDIFVATGEKDQWTLPQNVGIPVNSPADDFYMWFATPHTGYFASNRQGGKGNDDIYSFKMLNHLQNEGYLILETTVQDAKTRQGLPASLVSLSCDGLQPYTDTANMSGKTYHPIAIKHQPCQIDVFKSGYSRYQAPLTNLSLLKSDTIKLLVLLNKALSERNQPKAIPLAEATTATDIQVGDKIVLRNIHYDFDKDNIRPDAALILDTLVQILKKYPAMEIELASHTDSRGTDTYNLDLSDRRAKSAVQYLVKHGISHRRMVARGYGEMLPVNGCINNVPCSEAEHQDNRRTEVKITKM